MAGSMRLSLAGGLHGHSQISQLTRQAPPGLAAQTSRRAVKHDGGPRSRAVTVVTRPDGWRQPWHAHWPSGVTGGGARCSAFGYPNKPDRF